MDSGDSAFSTRAVSRITRVSGQGILSFTVANGDSSVAVALSPDALSTFMSRFTELMEAFQLFRFTSLKLRAYSPLTPLTSSIGYSNGDPTVVLGTTTAGAVAQLTGAIVIPASNATVNTYPLTSPQVLSVGKGVLLRDAPNKWWRTQPGTAVEAWEENQGEFVWALSTVAATGPTLVTQLFYTIELTSPISPALIPREPQLTPAFLKFITEQISLNLATRVGASASLSKSGLQLTQK